MQGIDREEKLIDNMKVIIDRADDFTLTCIFDCYFLKSKTKDNKIAKLPLYGSFDIIREIEAYKSFEYNKIETILKKVGINVDKRKLKKLNKRLLEKLDEKQIEFYEQEPKDGVEGLVLNYDELVKLNEIGSKAEKFESKKVKLHEAIRKCKSYGSERFYFFEAKITNINSKFFRIKYKNEHIDLTDEKTKLSKIEAELKEIYDNKVLIPLAVLEDKNTFLEIYKEGKTIYKQKELLMKYRSIQRIQL